MMYISPKFESEEAARSQVERVQIQRYKSKGMAIVAMADGSI